MARQLTEEQKAKMAKAREEWKASGGIRNQSKPQVLEKHTIRHRAGGDLIATKYNKTKAIKFMCYECFGFNGSPLKECVDQRCPLYPFRGGSQAVRHDIQNQDDDQEDDSDDASE